MAKGDNITKYAPELVTPEPLEKGFKYNHSDFCHCSDYNIDICPEECFRARITKELKEADPPYPYPVSMGNFRHSGYCPLTDMEDNNDVSNY